jgi:hypothetical protein
MGIPVDAGVEWNIVKARTFGAVLVTTPTVFHHRLHHEFDVGPWFGRNQRQLQASGFWSRIQEHGLFVVTGTYSATSCSITAWSGSANEVYLGFSAEVAGIPAAGAHGGWCLGQSASGWSHYIAPVGCCVLQLRSGCCLQFSTDRKGKRQIRRFRDGPFV